jgi:hypothetical protein
MAKPIGSTYLGITSSGTVQNLRSVGNLLINANSIATLDDCNINSPANSDVLIYDSSSTKFINRSLLFNSDLADVEITDPQENQKMAYNTTLSKWINISPQFFFINIYGKFRDSYIQSLVNTIFINLLYNDPLVFDTYNITSTGHNGLNINTSNLIVGIRNNLSVYNYNYMNNLSILTIDNNSQWAYGLRNSTNGLITQISTTNTLNNPNRQLNTTSNTTIADQNGFYPFLTITGASNYTGNTIADFSFSFLIYEL